MALLAAGQVVASALLDPVCERLINTALEEYALVRGVKEEIEKLRFTVDTIKAVLRDAEGKQVGSELVRTWLSSLKQILFDAQDVLDEVATDAALRRRDRPHGTPRLVRSNVGAKVRNIICCFGTAHNFLADRGIARQIKHIRERLDAKSNEINSLGLVRLGVDSMPVFSTPRRPPTSSLPTDGGDVIGRDDEKKKLEELLLVGCGDGPEGSSSSRSNDVQVITITGMGGVGKTTLVKLVYNSPRVKQHFHPTIWVCVSNDFDLKRISGEIMDVLISPDKLEGTRNVANWDKTQLSIKEKIEGKRFLLVLDDMWEEKDHAKWESLCEPLRYGGKGSKIVVTARSQRVSSHLVKGTPIPLQILSSGSLRSVFERFAFERCDLNKRAQLEPVGRQIADKLKGLPLAAKIVGRLLNARLDVDYWQSILRSERWAQSHDPNDILPVLKLSYDQLPGHLKQCFAYCSLFPKDYSFSKDELVQLWTAQTFIHVPKGSHADQSGMNENFDDLLHASFFEQSRGEDFVMHDLIHDLAESVSQDECFKLVQNDRNERIPETVRHVSVATDSFDPMRLDELCKLRTLLFLHPVDLNLHLDALFMKFKRLRVLSLSRCKIKELPKSIGTLKHLRYVDLSSTLITMLPKSICNLHNLQVLNLGGCRLLDSLPRNMSSLVNLSHLVVDNEVVSDCVQHLGKLTALQELTVAGGKLKELAHMGMLRQLRILRLEEVTSKEEALQARLEAKVHLDVLELEWSDDRPHRHPLRDQEVADALQPVNSIRELLVKNYGGISPPRWMEGPSWASASTSFQLLQRVVLEDCKNWEVLPPLGELPCLKFLKIRGMSAVTRIGPRFYGGGGGARLQPGFPSLEELEFGYMTEWEEWEAPPHQQPLLLFPRLRTLDICDCMKLKELPPLPPTLDYLRIIAVGLTHLPGWMRCSDDIIDHDGGGGGSDVTPSTWSSSPSLSSLFINNCPNLTSLGKGLLQQPLPTLKRLTVWRCPELASLPETQFRHLTSLETLSIEDCPKLSSPPPATREDALPSSLQGLFIRSCGDTTGADLLLASIHNLTSLSRLAIDVGSPDAVAAVGQLTSLTFLHIDGGSHVDDAALSTCLRGLTSSLKSLIISDCSAITTLASSSGEVRRRLTALEELKIYNCPKLLHLGHVSPRRLWIVSSSLEQITMWLRQCPSLEELFIENCPQLTCIDGELETSLLGLAPSLRHLEFFFCKNLRVLPAKLRDLSSLDRLAIWGSPKIESLPSAGLPKSLDSLEIRGCPELVDRCKKKGCPDWPLLSHIREVVIRG